MKKLNFLLFLVLPFFGFAQNHQEQRTQEVIDGKEVTVIRTTMKKVVKAQPKPKAPVTTAVPKKTNTSSNSQKIKGDNFLRESAEDKKLTAADMSEYRLTSEHISSISGVHHLYYRQQYNGVDVADANASVHILPSGEKALAVHNYFVKDLATKISGSSAPGLSAIEAVQAAAAEMNYSITKSLTVLENIGGKTNKAILNDGGISVDDISAELIYQTAPDGRIVLSWNLIIHELSMENWWDMRVDASTGKILAKKNWVTKSEFGNTPNDKSSNYHDASLLFANNTAKNNTAKEEAKNMFVVGGYNVYPMPLENPYYGGRSVINDPDDATASPFGWHDTNGANGAEFTITRGNNVHAFENGDNVGFSPDGGAGLVFNFPINTIYSAGDQSESAILTNLFYWNNVIHDVVYQYGFDEASGNFQENNYGNGGAASDYVNAWGQTGLLCNAFFATPPDGSNPTMQMYVGTCGANNRDGSLDNLVVAHEYGHGISNRLTGGAANVGCLDNDEQMGEGWSDFYGLILTMESTHTATTPRGVGTFLFGQGAGGPGIRAFPYTTDIAADPRTYDDIKTTGTSPHALGSIWTAMLWEVTWALIDQYGYDADFYTGTGGNNIAMNLVTEAMKLQPCSPGFVDGRDAILAADVALYAGANQCLIWEAFAKRGLGFSATQGSSDDRTDGAEAFDLPANACCQLDVSCALITDQTLSCKADLPPVNFDFPIIIESCGDVTFAALTIIPGDSGCPGDEISITRTYFIQDDAGNMAECMQTFTVVSNVAPTIVCPGGGVVECAADISVNAADAVVSSECGTPSVAVSGPVINGTPDCPFTTYTYTYTVTDHCGRMASCDQVFTILNAEPTIVCPADMVVECAADIVVNPNDAVVTTSCTLGFNTIVTGPVIDGQPDCPGTMYTYMYTATDDCGRIAQCKRVFIIQNDGPMVTCPADQVVQCVEDIVTDVNDLVVTTSCGLGYSAYIKQPLITGGIPGCDGTVYTYIYVVLDECGREAECEQQFLIQNDAPTVTVPAGGTVTCFDDIQVSPSDASVVTDCPSDSYVVNVLQPVLNGPANCPGTTYTFTYRVKDNCNRIVEVDRVFTIGSNDAPTITAPADGTVNCLGSVNVNPDNAIVTTACGNGTGYQVEVTGPQILGTMDCPNTTYRYTYTVTDACGRTASDIRNLTVSNDPPVFYGCDEDNWLQFNCEDYGGEDGTIAAIEAYIASVEAYTSCGVQLPVINNFNSNNINTCINNGINTITFRATDNCGRTSFCTTTYVVVDTEAPKVYQDAEDHWEICNYNSPQNFQAWVNNNGGAEAYDGCSNENVSWSTIPSNPSFNCMGASGVTSVTVTFVVQDNCGNSTSTTATFNAFMGGGDLVENDEGQTQEDKGVFELYQNSPNPFKQETMISFNLPEAQEASLIIYDLSGKTLKTIQGDFVQGYNEVSINRSALPGSGVLIYRLITPTESATMKMILSN